MYEYHTEIITSAQITEVLNHGGKAGWKYVSCQLVADDTFLVIMDRYVQPEDEGREVDKNSAIAMRG